MRLGWTENRFDRLELVEGLPGAHSEQCIAHLA